MSRLAGQRRCRPVQLLGQRGWACCGGSGQTATTNAMPLQGQVQAKNASRPEVSYKRRDVERHGQRPVTLQWQTLWASPAESKEQTTKSNAPCTLLCRRCTAAGKAVLPSPDGASGSAQDAASLSWTSPTMLVTASAMATRREVRLVWHGVNGHYYRSRRPLHMTQTWVRGLGRTAVEPIP